MLTVAGEGSRGGVHGENMQDWSWKGFRVECSCYCSSSSSSARKNETRRPTQHFHPATDSSRGAEAGYVVFRGGQSEQSITGCTKGRALSATVTNCIAAESSRLKLLGFEVRLKNITLPVGTARTKHSTASITAFSPLTPLKQNLPSQSQTSDGLGKLKALSTMTSNLFPQIRKQQISKRNRRAHQWGGAGRAGSREGPNFKNCNSARARRKRLTQAFLPQSITGGVPERRCRRAPFVDETLQTTGGGELGARGSLGLRTFCGNSTGNAARGPLPLFTNPRETHGDAVPERANPGRTGGRALQI